MFKRKDKKSEKTYEHECGVLPGWDGPWKNVATCLRDGGGRPEAWEEETKDGSPASVLATLTRIPVALKAPLGGVQQRMWMCAAAWKNQYQRRIKQETLISQQKQQITQLANEISILKQQQKQQQLELETVTTLAGRAIAHVSKVNRKNRKKPPRNPNPPQIRAFVARMGNGEDWDPDNWDGNIWGDDTDERPEWGPRPDPPTFPPTLRANPVVRRRRVERHIPPDMRPLRDDQGQPIVDAQGLPMYEMINQAQPEPEITRTLEDYTSEEVSHLVLRLRRKPDEPLDMWLVRLLEDGGVQTEIDGTDGVRFSGLSRDVGVDMIYRRKMAEQQDDITSLFLAYATAVNKQYPMPSDWPSLDRPWLTLREGIQRLVRLSVREALTVGMLDRLSDMPVPKAVRDHLIKTAPTAYKSLVLTITLGSPNATMGEIRSMMSELGSLGEWSTSAPEARHSSADRRPPRREGSGNGPSRRELWNALMRDGVPVADIDGKPTSELRDLCKKRGVKISCVTDLNQVTRLLANLCREGSQHQDVRPKPEKQRPDTDSSEGDEELDQYETARVARRKGKKGKNKDKRKTRLYPDLNELPIFD